VQAAAIDHEHSGQHRRQAEAEGTEAPKPAPETSMAVNRPATELVATASSVTATPAISRTMPVFMGKAPFFTNG
jgi:hypothetical protein